MAADPYNWDARVDAWEEVAATDAFGALHDRIVREAAPRRGDRVLDLGAGTGLVPLRQRPHRAVEGGSRPRNSLTTLVVGTAKRLLEGHGDKSEHTADDREEIAITCTASRAMKRL